ncbi:MFS transporter [Phycicoccus duodecadis]|uniref:Putative MFS family arabinose efflux permease n=1 Tax=Phycicoccus duodecadis TaxID=173053 RepID=A0A2N3YN51_9MICO|nr:MFS transporter [Phycicoccus duodecadis]PKW28291.1 putative MFS family arabinose efflux permease [Phycicoccus duodecadis]
MGTLVRTPVFATSILVTIHVVTTLGRSYVEAGVVAAAATISIAVSGPWRGRLLDKLGLRRVVAPSLLVSGVCWGLAPWVGYYPLLVLVVVAGLFVVPTFSVIRQAIIAAVPERDRRTAISLDSAALELCFMVAPAVGVWASTVWGTAPVLFVVQMIGVLAGAVLWVADPPLRADSEDGPGAVPPPRRTWMRPRFLAVCVIGAVATLVLAGSDLGFVAMMRAFDAVPELGLVLAVWGLGSLIGGLVYGALSREIPSTWLLVTLGLVTAPMAFATSPVELAVLAFVAGVLCAPTITATVAEASRLVPANARGEALGWHGSSITAGGAVGAPFAGWALDGHGPGAGFLAIAAVGVGFGLVSLLVSRRPAARPAERVDTPV